MTVKKKYILTILLNICFLSLFFIPSIFARSIHEYPYIYKSPRAMGMGGAYTAIGGAVDTLFYNPAGLSNMEEMDMEVSLIRLSLETGSNSLDMYEDGMDVVDAEDKDGDGKTDDDQLDAGLDMFAKYRGENLHINASELLTVGLNSGKFAFGFAGIATGKADTVFHQGFGKEGILETHGSAYGGGLFGISFNALKKDLLVGASVKYLYKLAISHNFTIRELVDSEELADTLMDDYKEEGYGMGYDFGAIYKFAPNNWLKPTLGVSVLNVGGLTFDNNAGEIPQTVNLGVAINPELAFYHSWVVGLDYVDVLGDIKTDDNLGKRLRLGTELNLFDHTLGSVAIRGGFYQGYPSYGALVRLMMVELTVLSYSEEIGLYAGHKKDSRLQVMLNIGW